MKRVLKFGGTSTGSAENIKSAVNIILEQKSTVTVLSAMSGTTDTLIKISELAAQGGKQAEIVDHISTLRKKYQTNIELLLKESKKEALQRMENTFDLILSESRVFTPNYTDRVIIAQGELLTTAIFTLYMKELGHKTVLLHAPTFMLTNDEGRIMVDQLSNRLSGVVTDSDTYYITQGFICTNSDGEIDNLGRGGSDYSAALIAAAIEASQLQVWTDIDGMHNNDPRFVENTRPIPLLSFDEAAELAYFGAKILHPATIQPCKERNIPVLLKNTMSPTDKGTKISAEEDLTGKFRAVAAKDGITVIRIYSTRMLMAYGFLRKVFEIFEEHKTPIDMITTSEVAVSLTIDNDSQLDHIVQELKELGKIEVEKNNTIVCIVGDLDHGEKGLVARITGGVRDIPIKMISYGASHRGIALLVEAEYKKKILQALNDTLF